MDLFAFDDLYVRRLKEHDRETEAHFYQYIRPLLFGKVKNSVPAQHIDDIIQEVFLRVLSRLDDVRDCRKFGAFVQGICNNIVLEWIREISRTRTRTQPLTEAHEQIVDKKSNAEKDFLSKEAAEAVRLVLSDLGERDASILGAVFLTEEPREETCRRFDVSPEYLAVLLHRAKEKFKAAYEKRKKKKWRRIFSEIFRAVCSLPL